jgi:hypothetical protein
MWRSLTPMSRCGNWQAASRLHRIFPFSLNRERETSHMQKTFKYNDGRAPILNALVRSRHGTATAKNSPASRSWTRAIEAKKCSRNNAAPKICKCWCIMLVLLVMKAVTGLVED